VKRRGGALWVRNSREKKKEERKRERGQLQRESRIGGKKSQQAMGRYLLELSIRCCRWSLLRSVPGLNQEKDHI